MEPKAYLFDDFRVDLGDCALLQGGNPVALTPKAFDTLRLLVENSGRLLDKDLMMERLWPDAHVEEANLANNISLLRKALGASGARIQTVPRRGYRFAGEVRVEGDGDVVAAVEPAGRSWTTYAIAAAIAIAALAAGLLFGRAQSKHDAPAFRQITFRRGIIHGARYGSDGETIVYCAAHEDRPPELFLTRADQQESKALGVQAEALLAVSRRGDLAILTKATWMAWVPRGTLALMPLTGGAPREILDEVQDADFAADGNLAIIRWEMPVARVEYPIGHVLYKAVAPAWVSGLRVSPDGDEIAFLLHESERFDDRGRAVVIDRKGAVKRTSRVFTSAYGLAWAPGGREIWVTASAEGLNNSIYAIDGRGRDRRLAGTAGRLMLADANARGEALSVLEESRIGIIVRGPGERGERELSWLDGSWLRDISADGRTILFDEEGTAGGTTARVYVRRIDGAPAVNLGPGHAVALSPDGRWALARQRFTVPPRLMLIPTGAGPAKAVATGGIEPTERAAWLPDGLHFVFTGSEPAHRPRVYLHDIAHATTRPVTPEGVTGSVVTADGRWVIGRARGSAPQRYPIDGGGPPEPIAGLSKEDGLVRFASDGRGLFAITDTEIVRIDIATGARLPVWTYGAARPAGCIFTGAPAVAANGAAYAYTYASESSTLFAVDTLE